MRYVLLSILSLIFINIFGQDTASLVKYDYSFQFKDGLYITFSDLKNNNPVPYERVIDPPSDSPDFFEMLDEAETISFNDQYGASKEIKKSALWGYSKNGKPYVYWSDKFNLIPYIGNISYFMTTVKVYYTTGGYDPFYSSYYYNNYYPVRTHQTEELRQFLIDFGTGRVLDYDSRNIEALLSKDPEIHKEYSKLGKRKKNKKNLDYIRLYNNKFPLYMPGN